MSSGECQTGNRGDYDNVRFALFSRTVVNDSLFAGTRVSNPNHVFIYFGRTHTRTQEDGKDDKTPPPLDEADIALLKSYGLGPYNVRIKALEEEIKKLQSGTHDLIGIPESDTGLAPPSMWDLVGDKQMMSEEAPLQVARCTKIITDEVIVPTADGSGADASAMSSNAPAANAAHADGGGTAGKQKYVINVKQIAKFVVDLGEKVAPTDIEEGMRVGVDRSKYSIQIPLPPKIDPTVSLMTVEDKPDVTYDDVGGAKDAMEKLREVLELPLCIRSALSRSALIRPRACSCTVHPVRLYMASYDVASSCAFCRGFVDRSDSLPLFFHSIRSFINRNRQDLVRPRRGQSHRRLLYSCDRVGTGAKVRRRRRAHGPRTLHHGPFQARVHYLF
jgi:hypothetical protein